MSTDLELEIVVYTQFILICREQDQRLETEISYCYTEPQCYMKTLHETKFVP